MIKKNIDSNKINFKAGTAVIVGRPNSGKSTLLNNLLGSKVTITSPKPQTTRFTVEALYQDERGQIIFIDTPGITAKIKDRTSRFINPKTEDALKLNPDIIVYVCDHTKDRDIEENKMLGIVRKINTPKLLVYNKTDIFKPSYLAHYKFMEEEFNEVIKVSALKGKNINLIIETIFKYLPEREPIVKNFDRPTPLISMDAKTFIAEIVREKAFLFLRKELPYSITCITDEISENNKRITVMKVRIITNEIKYKKMIIGKTGRMIKEIGTSARKELEISTGKRIFLDIKVEVNPHWQEQYFG